MDSLELLADRLKEARENSGLLQEEAAAELQISPQMLHAWETKASLPDTEKIPDLARLYGVTVDWLMNGKELSPKVKELTKNLSDRLFSEVRMTTYISSYCNAKKFYQTKKALDFARKSHQGQTRKKGHTSESIPYIYHPLLLTCHALALGLEDDDLLSTCLLHDVCEDCGVLPEELPVEERVRTAVSLLTKPEGFHKTEEEQRAYYDAIATDPIAMMVKILDRCNNISSMANSFSDEHMADYIQETENYIRPLMQKLRYRCPEYDNALFLIKYHMNSVMEALKHHMWSEMQ